MKNKTKTHQTCMILVNASFEEAYEFLLNSKNCKHSSRKVTSESLVSSLCQHNTTVSNMLEYNS